MNGLHAESFIWLTDARWDTIDAPEKAVRVRRGFDLATSDVTGLDDLALRTLIDTAEPSMWWAETKLGHRVLAALERLEDAYALVVQHGPLQLGWDFLECATAYYGLAIWLSDQTSPARFTELATDQTEDEPMPDLPTTVLPDADLIRMLLEHHGCRAEWLAAGYAEACSDIAERVCIAAARQYGRGLLENPDVLDDLWLACNGVTPSDTDRLLDAVADLIIDLERRIGRAAHQDDLDRLGALLPIGAGMLMLCGELVASHPHWLDSFGDDIGEDEPF